MVHNEGVVAVKYLLDGLDLIHPSADEQQGLELRHSACLAWFSTTPGVVAAVDAVADGDQQFVNLPAELKGEREEARLGLGTDFLGRGCPVKGGPPFGRPGDNSGLRGRAETQVYKTWVGWLWVG